MAFKNTRRNTSTKRFSQDQLFNEIAKLAYQFYVDRGYQHGNDMDDWLRAERIVKARYNLD
ncbi:MAG: DUF2934 domain-containing protein [Candidatus Omnitrophica bacterium]|nr:DUF2934 domain-containing protein [Candidatus Omnitrophota bacterium]